MTNFHDVFYITSLVGFVGVVPILILSGFSWGFLLCMVLDLAFIAWLGMYINRRVQSEKKS